MAYDMKYGKGYGMMKKQGDMAPVVKDCAIPDKAFAQKYDQSPTMYKERQDYMQGHEGKKLKGESFKGRYDYM